MDDFLRIRRLLKKSPSSIALRAAYKDIKKKISPHIISAKQGLLSKIEKIEQANIQSIGFTIGLPQEDKQVVAHKDDIALLNHYVLS